MCGIAGVLESGVTAGQWEEQLRAMNEALVHRGPDDAGILFDADAGAGLAHRRLSVLDLSKLGRQPMVSASGRYRITYNGEIYNFQDLRKTLAAAGHTFRSETDTEVLLAAIEAWGIEAALRECNGMFAFALWDHNERKLHLARDRVGIKPLYYGWQGSTFLFASELKGLRRHPAFRREINRNAVSLLLRHGYIPAPHSIYTNVFKLLPGTILTITPGRPDHALEPKPYWSSQDLVENGQRNPFAGDVAYAADHLEILLKDAVKMRMIADVPLGAFLSGGYDSTTVVALMQAQSDRPVRTYSIGFEDAGFNEAEKAKAVAAHLGTEHTELYIDSGKAAAVIPQLPQMYDEPLGDGSQIPTFLVSQLARQSLTVSLSGDGGDELFAGYHHYKTLFDAQAGAGNNGRLPDWVAAKMRQPFVYWRNPETVVQHARESQTLASETNRWPDLPRLTQQRMYLDFATYLPDDILTKLDRASMAVSLESRVPLLDHRVVEFAWRLPLFFNLGPCGSKLLLRKVLYRYVPPALVDGQKMGFTLPIANWLRGDLRPWAEALINEDRLKREGIFHAAPIRQKWQKYLNEKESWLHNALWAVLMFQSWLENERNL